MGILASFIFIIVFLVIGFRYNNWTLATMLFMGSGIFVILLAQSNIQEIMANWNDRRCDLEVMITAQMFQPADDIRSSGEFAAENFNFCTRRIFQQVINVALAPIFGLLNQQLNIAESVGETMNQFRVVQANFMKGFNSLLDPFFKRFKQTGAEFGVTYQKLLSAMGRAFGITQAMVYIGMSLVLAVENFVHLVINVVMVVMYIILGFMIILFPLFLPFFGLIIYTCQVIGNSQFGYLSEDVCGELCFDPHTVLHLQKGVTKPIGQCQIGDSFEDGTIIEGILTVNGEKEPMFLLDGVRVSGAHLVWFNEKKEWIPVAHHPQASLTLQPCPLLICLRTSTRRIPIRGQQTLWQFRDWEELPLNLHYSDTIWDFLVQEILNKSFVRTSIPEEHPLLKASCKVMYKTGEMRRLSEVHIGDCIYSSEGFTTITGVYKGKAKFLQEQAYTDGIWMKPLGEAKWNHPSPGSLDSDEQEGFHLTTESGCFWIQANSFSGFVRDFTEVGAHQISLTYPYTRKLLKKSSIREESCVSDSLSQVLLSSSQPIY